MNSLHLVAAPLRIVMMKLAIVMEIRMLVCVVTQTAKQKHQLVAGFMPHTEPKLNVQMD